MTKHEQVAGGKNCPQLGMDKITVTDFGGNH